MCGVIRELLKAVHSVIKLQRSKMYNKKVTWTLGLLFPIIAQINALEDLPSFFPKCSRNDPKLSECLVSAGNGIKSYLIKGIPELEISSISPYQMPEITIQQGTHAVNFKLVMSNTTVLGLETYNLTQLEYDVKQGKFFGNLSVGPLHLDGYYKINSNILTLPLVSEGNYHINISFLEATLNQEVKLESRGGKNYIESTNVTVHVEVEPKDVTLEFKKLFENNKILSDVCNDVVKNNLHVILEDVRPICEAFLANLMQNMLEKIHTRVPYNKLYPPGNN